MHGFIFDELFQQRGRRVPGNALQFQEADIEPRREPVLEFAIERLQFLVVPQEAQQIDAHVDEELDALGNGIELGEDADAPRAHGHAQPSLGVPLSRRTDRALIGLVGPGHLLGIRAELERDQAQEAMPPLVVKLEIGLRKPHCPLSGRYFSAQSFHAVGQLGADLVEEARDSSAGSLPETIRRTVDKPLLTNLLTTGAPPPDCRAIMGSPEMSFPALVHAAIAVRSGRSGAPVHDDRLLPPHCRQPLACLMTERNAGS